MVSYNVTNVWELIVLYLLVFAVLAFFSFGKSNLMRLIAHYFKFGYSDKKLKRLDREWRDIQLFKTLNGINVSGIEDVRMIQQGLIDGKLKTSDFFLTRFWGDITEPPCITKTMSAVLAGILYIIFACYIHNEQSAIVRDAIGIPYKNMMYYVYSDKVLLSFKNKTVEFNKTYSLADCKSLQNVFIKNTLPEIACNKLLQLNEEDSEWLSQEIKDNNSHRKTLLIISLIYFISGLLIFLSYTKFFYANKKVLEYKASNKNHS
ncbi:hypothetical protein [Escherichia coli]|uniref:hypothetical protein n=1 Tax=Escherichia coli TaxID=562 RepID=UPI000BE3F887|nr:hypothetical protein [Escherichia coli]EGO4114305.1 hypothetical protein [Escherichia coli]MBB2363469.1 hypothetical protein [Escherichia coli]QHN43674.1 hypothetical protein GQN55_01740 [Salmonella sp. S13]